MRTDRAVLSSFVLSADGSLSPAGGFAVIRLSDGRQLLRRDYREPAPFFNVTVSADARYLVGSPQADTSQARSRVLDLTTGREVAQVDGYGLGFSSDDRFLAVSSRRLPATTVPGGTTGRLVDWRTGRTVWQGQGELDVLGYDLASPAIAVQLASSDAPPPDHDRYLIVRPDGISVTIKQDGNITPTG